MSREIKITKDMLKLPAAILLDGGLKGVFFQMRGCTYKIERAEGWMIKYHACQSGKVYRSNLMTLRDEGIEIITPKERPDLYGIEKVTEKPKNIDCEYPNCDFTKTVYIDTGREVLKVNPEDIIIVRKNQVCFVNKQTDSLQDAMVSDCSNNAPAVTLDNLVLELCDYYPSRQELVSALVNLKVINVKDDYSEELANVKGLFSGKEKYVR